MPDRHPPLIGLTPPEGSFARRSEGHWVPRSAAQVLADIGGAAAATWNAARLTHLDSLYTPSNERGTLQNDNWDTIEQSGFYEGYDATGAPSTGWWYLIHVEHRNTDHYSLQLAFALVTGTPYLYKRTRNGGTWSGWTVGEIDMLPRATYVGYVAAGTNTEVAHGWGDRPTIIGGWHDGGAGNGLYHIPMGTGLPPGSTGASITHCDATNLTISTGSNTNAYCYVTGIFPRAQQ